MIQKTIYQGELMKKIVQIVAVLLFGVLMFFAGYRNSMEEIWKETYVLPGSGMVLQFTDSGQLNTIVSGYYSLEEMNGNRYLYMVESDEEDIDSSIPYVLRVNDDNTIRLDLSEISGIENSESMAQTLQYVSGTDGLKSGVDAFEGKYKDKNYDNYEIEFLQNGRFTSVMSARYKATGNNKLVLYGDYGKTSYTYEKDIENGTLRLQTGGTFDVTFFLEK